MQLYIPIIGLVVAVFLLIFLALRTRVHILIAMIIASAIAGLSGGLTASETIGAISSGFGSTLGSIGIVIGLGIMMGRVLEVSGAAERIAYSFIKWLGTKREEWALAITGYIVSIPIFVDSAFVILFPLIKALAKSSKKSVLTLTISLAGGLILTHHVVPPTPGPLGVAGIYGVNIGSMLILGMFLAIPCIIGVVLYAQWLGRKYPDFIVPDVAPVPGELKEVHDQYMQEKEEKDLPSLLLSILPILIPIILIFLDTTMNMLSKLPSFAAVPSSFVGEIISFLGSPIIALSISVLVAVYTLMPHQNKAETTDRLEEGLQSAGIILLVTGAGGALGAVLRESGTGTLIAEHVALLPITPILIPFLISTIVRVIQGSGTVAMITAASISAPIIAQFPEINPLVAAQAATLGALFFSYFNDSMFWVINRMLGVKDVKMQMMVWSIPTTIAWAIGLVFILILNAIL